MLKTKNLSGMKASKNILLLILIACCITSCSKIKDFGDTNTDPNRTTVPFMPALLSNVTAGIGSVASQANPGYYAQYFAETQYPAVSLYTLPQFDFDGFYAGPMNDCQTIINYNSDSATKLEATGTAEVNGSNKNQIAVARILKAYYTWTITDAWGDIPYSEAFKGLSNKFPKYDSQEDVYKSILTELKESVAQFDKGPGPKGDVIYDGDVVKWKKLANSLRMLVALRMSKRYPDPGGLAANEFNSALLDAAGSITTNDDNFTLHYPGGNFRNPWYATYDGRKDLGQSEYFINLLNSLGDKRQTNKIFGSSDVGVPYGRSREYMNNIWGAVFSADGWSRVLGDAFRKDSSSVAIVPASVVLFARAEAKERGWTLGTELLTAKELYETGVTVAQNQWGIATADAATYLSGSQVKYGTDNLKKIALQRYIALYPDGLQAWCEWRRTNVPVLVPAVNAANTGGQIPRRFVYGVNDYSTNRASVLAAAALIPAPPGGAAGDTQDGRVWWDR